MNYKTIFFTVTLSAFSLFTFQLYGQDQPAVMSTNEHARMDSLQKVDKKVQQEQKAKDERTIDNAKAKSNDTKAKAKEAKRVENDANDASNQSKKALKTEKKAQKARKDADEQAKKASDARDKSNNN